MILNAITMATSKARLPQKYRPPIDLIPAWTNSFKIIFREQIKLILTLLIIGVIQFWGSKVYGQITLKEKSIPLEKVLRIIEKQTDYVFLYTGKDIQNLNVNVDVTNLSVTAVLDKCLKSLPLTYKIVGKNILLKKTSVTNPRVKPIGVQIRVSGRVIDSLGRPLISATVINKDNELTVLTNANGEFDITASPGDQIIFSFIGYKNYQIKADPNAATQNIILYENISKLSEVVVNTGYQELPKERATGSFIQVDNALINRSVSTDVIDRLKDVVPGLSFNHVGTRLSIRGQSTLFSNADPLIVVDGFPYNQPIENLNPNDVESITVLKDAAAASIWGTKAGNGVIVITTKRGTFNKKPTLSLNANVTVGDRPNLFAQPRMSSSDYIDIEKRLFTENFYNSTETGGGHFPLSPVIELLIAKRDGKLTAGAADAQINALRSQDLRNDVTKYLYRNSVNQQYAASLAGGSVNQRYFFSAGADKNLTNTTGNNYERITLNGSNTWELLSHKLQLTTALYLTESKTQRNSPLPVLWNNGANIYPYANIADANGNPVPVTGDYRLDFVNAAPASGLLDWNYRPLQDLNAVDNSNIVADQRFNTSFKYKIIAGLSAELRYQYERSATTGRNLQGLDSYYTRNLINRFTQSGPGGVLTRPVPIGSILDLSNGTSVNHDGRAQLNYEHLWGTKHDISAIAGYEVQSLHVEGNTNRVYGYDAEHATSRQVDGLTYFPYYDNQFLGNSIPQNLNENDGTDHSRSYYANAAYTYDRRYTISGSARLDQSNLFGVATNQKGVPLWSTGFAWEVDREAFYHFDWLSQLKLRATYGYNGNINKSLSAYTTAIYLDGSDNATLLPYARIVNPPNPNLRWERISNINLGLDFATKGNRLSGTLEFFWKKGLDLIGNTAYAPSTGITAFTGNTASTAGHGLDLNLESRNIAGIFSWTTSYFVSYYIDKVTDYDQQSTATTYVNSANLGGFPLIGKPLYAIYSYEWAGLDPANGDPQGYLNGAVSKNYTAILAAARPDNLLYNGPSRPSVFGAVRNTVAYKNVSLSANISYKFGYYFRRRSVRYGSDHGLSQQSGDYALRWQQSGDEANTNIPSMPSVANLSRDNFYTYSSALVEKGDHIRLNDVNLSYSLNRNTLGFLGSGNLQVYVYAANLGILWRANKQHIDPDYPTTYPAPKTIAGGVRFTY